MRQNQLRILLLLILITTSAVVIYLRISDSLYRLGYPLDDAWIHQTYARNLAELGEWSFIPGIPSGGSTSPLWSGILSVGYWAGVVPIYWTYFLGLLFFAGISILGFFTYQIISTKNGAWAIAAGIILALEWHLIWVAVSGMETSLFTFLSLWIIYLLTRQYPNWIILGGLIGLSIWVRPDGVTLILPSMILMLIQSSASSKKIRVFLEWVFGLLIVLLPYLWFNRSVAGSWLPNTFFAKQAEYAVELQASLVSRLLEQSLLPLVGVGICLVPGLVLFIWDRLKKMELIMLVGPLWALAYLSLYAVRLPVTYQHGRYVIPMMPVYFVWGFAGLAEFIRINSEIKWMRLLSRVWVVVTFFVLLSFSILGANAYARDVAVIESEMVNTAKWVAENTDSSDLIAAHDIGALGYYGERRLLDLAGLITPEVIPIIRDEVKLSDYISDQRADYLVTFPGWYPYLVEGLVPIYETGGDFSPKLGGENMHVYVWKARP